MKDPNNYNELAIFLWSVILLASLFWWWSQYPYKTPKPKQPSILREWIKAKKSKVCPLIKVED